MSENRIAASTPCRRTGCSVISQVRSGVEAGLQHPGARHAARGTRAASGPAWRMNHTGARRAPPRAATRNGRAPRSRRAFGGAVGLMACGLHDHPTASHAPGPPTGPGAPARSVHRADLESLLVPDATVHTPEFRRAVASLSAIRPRPELFVRSPGRAAPARAVHLGLQRGGRRRRPPGEDLDEPDTSGRLILLHDPAGQDAWEGTFRLVCFVQARLEPEQLGDEMFPVVGWSWLTEALEHNGAGLPGPRRHGDPDVFGPVRRHLRIPPGRRRGAPRVLDTRARPGAVAPRRRVLSTRRVGGGPAAGRSSSTGSIGRCDQGPTCGFAAA